MGFFQGLEENIRAASNAALIKSVVCDPDQTIGDVLEALEAESDAVYLLEAFRNLTIGQIVHAALEEIQNLGQQEIDKMEQPAAPPKKVKVKAADRKKSPPRKNGKTKGTEGIDLSTPEARKAYEASILKTLKGGKHVDEQSGITSQELRAAVGGEAAQSRVILDELIEAGRVAFYGKARGMRYYLFA